MIPSTAPENEGLAGLPDIISVLRWTHHRILALHTDGVLGTLRKVSDLVPLCLDGGRSERLIGLEVRA